MQLDSLMTQQNRTGWDGDGMGLASVAIKADANNFNVAIINVTKHFF